MSSRFSSSHKPLSGSRRLRARSCSRHCQSMIPRFASPTSRGPGSFWAGSRRSSSRRGCGECCRASEGSHLGSRKMKRTSIALIVIALCAFAATARPGQASAARHMMVGMYEPVYSLTAPATTFATFKNLRVQVLRLDLGWRAVAKKRPAHPLDPDDPAYDWDVYDTFVLNARKNRIAVIFSILGTPAWANGGKKPNRAPTRMVSLRYFANVAAKRYSGTFKRPDG